MKKRAEVSLVLNGEPVIVKSEDAGLMFADYVRERRGKTGTKIVCAEGDCGACTVLVAKKSARKNETPFLPVNSCIARVGQFDGASVVTVEALSGEKRELSTVQSAFREAHGSQCGFCTPGFVMALAGLADRRKAQGKKKIEAKEAQNALTGNLCRCTGYSPIIEGATKIELAAWKSLEAGFFSPVIQKRLRETQRTPLEFKSDSFSFAAPVKAGDVTAYLKRGYRVLSGGTDFGVQVNKGKATDKKVLSLHLLEGGDVISVKKNSIELGARVTIADFRRTVEPLFPKLAGYFDLFASPQIKNIATVVGNIANGSPIGDSLPALMACNAEVKIQNGRRAKWLSLSRLYLAYRQLDLKKGEWISGVRLELPKQTQSVSFLKTSQRKDLDISAVNGALWLERGKNGKILELRLAVGGVSCRSLRFPDAEKQMRGQVLSAETRAQFIESVQAGIAPLSDLRGTSAFRRVILQNWLNETLKRIEAGEQV